MQFRDEVAIVLKQIFILKFCIQFHNVNLCICLLSFIDDVDLKVFIDNHDDMAQHKFRCHLSVEFQRKRI